VAELGAGLVLPDAGTPAFTRHEHDITAALVAAVRRLADPTQRAPFAAAAAALGQQARDSPGRTHAVAVVEAAAGIANAGMAAQKAQHAGAPPSHALWDTAVAFWDAWVFLATSAAAVAWLLRQVVRVSRSGCRRGGPGVISRSSGIKAE
jgi:hypothetical protein